jgi:hypothetical protein
MSGNSNSVDNVLSAFSVVDRGGQSISREQVRSLLASSEDIEAQGALCSHLLNSHYSSRISPSLELRDIHPFVPRYFLRCLKEAPSGEWSESRYTAGIALANWFKALIHDESVPPHVPLEIKASIENVWTDGSQELRDAILNAVLEHIFEDRDARAIFEDWRQHPTFGDLYDAACEWSDSQ